MALLEQNISAVLNLPRWLVYPLVIYPLALISYFKLAPN